MEKFVRLPDKDSLTVREVAKALDMHVSSIWAPHFARNPRAQASGDSGWRTATGVASDLVAFLENLNTVHEEVQRKVRREQQEDQVRAANRVLEALLAEGL